MMYCDIRLGGTLRYSLGKPKDFNMRIPDHLLNCVVFLCVPSSSGSIQPWTYGGTAFVVSVPFSVGQNTHLYLVTARHCVENAKKRGQIHMRINRRTPPYDAEVVALYGDWWYPETDGVDVAVLPFDALKPEFQYEALPRSMFGTQDIIAQESIGAGDELIITGLFTMREGPSRNYPIARSGIIAAMANEPMENTNSGLPFSAHLAEIRSIGGLSGSPVFVSIGPERDQVLHSTKSVQRVADFESRQYYLLGLIQGHWDMKSTTDDMAFGEDDLKAVNMGIATVAPIHEVVSILDSPQVVKQRRATERELNRKRAPTEDSAFGKLEESKGFTRGGGLNRRAYPVPGRANRDAPAPTKAPSC